MINSTMMRRSLRRWFALFLLPMVAAFCSDSAALFAGMAFGKHKLIPDVSPKKTVEGAVGGIVLCIAFMALYAFAAGKISGLF